MRSPTRASRRCRIRRRRRPDMTRAQQTPTWTNRTGVAARILEAVLPLPVRIERVATSQLELGGAAAFNRVTTILELHGDGQVGRGEDIAYSADAQEALPGIFATL